MFRLIREDELEQAAKILTDNFSSYPLHKVYFPEEIREKCVYYMFLYRMYISRYFTYVTDDLSLIACVKKPDSKGGNPLSIFLKPGFARSFIKDVPFKSFLLLMEYSVFAARIEKGLEQPEDWHFYLLCTAKDKRGSRLVFDFLREFDEGKPIFCDTHTERNVRLYEHFGAKVIADGEWHGVHHYVMRREALSSEEERGRLATHLQPQEQTVQSFN